MATKFVFHPFPPPASHVGRARCCNVLRSLAFGDWSISLFHPGTRLASTAVRVRR
jgi:hypothetical protein